MAKCNNTKSDRYDRYELHVPENINEDWIRKCPIRSTPFVHLLFNLVIDHQRCDISLVSH